MRNPERKAAGQLDRPVSPPPVLGPEQGKSTGILWTDSPGARGGGRDAGRNGVAPLLWIASWSVRDNLHAGSQGSMQLAQNSIQGMVIILKLFLGLLSHSWKMLPVFKNRYSKLLQIWHLIVLPKRNAGPPRNSLFLFLLICLMQKEEEKN